MDRVTVADSGLRDKRSLRSVPITIVGLRCRVGEALRPLQSAAGWATLFEIGQIGPAAFVWTTRDRRGRGSCEKLLRRRFRTGPPL